MARLSLTLAAAGCAALLACSNDSLDDPAFQWEEAMERFGFISVFPLTENLQPGDVILYMPPEPNDDYPRPRMTRLAPSMSRDRLIEHLDHEAEDRLFLGSTRPPSSSTPGSGGNASPGSVTLNAQGLSSSTVHASATITPQRAAAAAPAPRAGSGGQASRPPPSPDILSWNADFAPHRRNGDRLALRMHRAAMPTITVGRFSAQDLGIAVPTQFGSISGGLSRRSATALTVSLGDLATLGLNMSRAHQLLDGAIRLSWLRRNLTPVQLMTLIRHQRPSLGEALCNADEAAIARRGRGEDEPGIFVVNTVLYAHRIEYGFMNRSETALRAAAELSRIYGGGASPTMAAPDGRPAQTAAAASGSDTSAVAAGIENRVGALGSSAAGLAPTSPGVVASLGVGRFGELSLSDTFQRPMAVGYNTIRRFSVMGSLLLMERTQRDNQIQLNAALSACRFPVTASPGEPQLEQRRQRLVDRICRNSLDVHATLRASFDSNLDLGELPGECFTESVRRLHSLAQEAAVPVSARSRARRDPFRVSPR